MNKVVLLDCPLEYKKGESNLAQRFSIESKCVKSTFVSSLLMFQWNLRYSQGQTNVEITKESDWEKLLQQEEVKTLNSKSL